MSVETIPATETPIHGSNNIVSALDDY